MPVLVHDMQTPPPPALKSGQTLFLSRKMRNVLERVQTQFSDLIEFVGVTKCSF